MAKTSGGIRGGVSAKRNAPIANLEATYDKIIAGSIVVNGLAGVRFQPLRNNLFSVSSTEIPGLNRRVDKDEMRFMLRQAYESVDKQSLTYARAEALANRSFEAYKQTDVPELMYESLLNNYSTAFNNGKPLADEQMIATRLFMKKLKKI